MDNTHFLLERAQQAIAEAKRFCDETRASVAATRQRFDHLHRPLSDWRPVEATAQYE